MENSEQHITGARKSTPIKKQTVLVVDDSADLLCLSKTILEMRDYEVFTALSGKEALSTLDEINRPDLILLDMQMEDMSGPNFLVELEKSRPDIIENVPVVFLTAMDKVPFSKAVGFIRKPFNIDKFLETVHRFIEMGIGRARLRKP